MKSEIAILLQEFGATIGLGSSLDLSQGGTIRLNLTPDFALDFEEEASGKKVWIYCDLFPGVDQTSHLLPLLQAMFSYHRTSDARLVIDPKGFQIMLVSSFSPALAEEHSTPLEQLDDHLKKLVALVETLRSSINKAS